MRFSLAVLPVAAALALVSATAVSAEGPSVQSNKKVVHGTAVEQSSNNSTDAAGSSGIGGIEKLFDDDGQEMKFLDFFDDEEDDQADDEDDSDESQPQRRAKKHTKHHKIAAKKNKHHQSKNSAKPSGEQFPNPVQVTWYASHDLLAPACGTGDWNPTSDSSIGAVMAGWSGGPKCGEFVDICNEDAGHKCVTVRVVDQCGGCNANAVDLTKKAFKKLSPSGSLDEGRMHNLKMYRHKKPNPWAVNLFGPFKLQKTGMV